MRDCTDDISISHTEESANRYVYLLGQTKEPLRIGVDVECRRRHISNALASRLKLMNKMAEPIVTWVLTEAFCKCLDEPLAIGSFLIRSKGLREGWNLWSFHPRNEPLKELQVEGFSKIEGDYALAVALTLPGGEANGASD